MPYIGNPIYQSAFVTDQFSGTGSQTAYTMSVAPAGTTNVLVVVSGVVQDPSTYGVVGNTLTFSAAPPSGTGNISCRYLGVPVTGVTTTAYRTVTEFTATASQTTFTPPSYNVGFINVYLNGVLLGSADYTATNGTTVVLATGASAGNLVTVESFRIESVANAIANAAGSVSSSNIQTSVTLTTPTIDKINTSVAYTSLGAGNSSIMKNRLINGAMVIAQRGTSTTVNDAAAFYAMDRWECQGQSADGVYTVAQSSTVPVGFVNSLLATVTTADASIGATQSYAIRQKIEGYNIADLGWGTANAKTVTVSFWVRSSLTGTFGGALINGGFSRSYPFSYTISAANTWEQKSVTITGDTTGTWSTDNSTGVVVSFSMGAGSSRLGTAGAWVAANNQGATGQTNIIATVGATWYMTGCQLEVGSSATGYEYRQYGQEFDLCRRYFESFVYANSAVITVGTGYSTSAADGTIYYYPKRATPTITLPATGTGSGQISYLKTDSTYPSTIGTIATGSIGVVNTRLNGTGFTSAWSAGNALWLYAATNATIQISAEL